jgi:hypothetical protein
LSFCQAAAGALDFEIDFSLWGENSGGGLKDGGQCTELSIALEKKLAELEVVGAVTVVADDEWHRLSFFADETLWQDEGPGVFLLEFKEKLERKGDKYEYVPNELAPLNKEAIKTAQYATSSQMAREFIDFLRNCGGFEIW